MYIMRYPARLRFHTIERLNHARPEHVRAFESQFHQRVFGLALESAPPCRAAFFRAVSSLSPKHRLNVIPGFNRASVSDREP